MWSRIHLIPLLQAEEDRDLVRRTLAAQAMEKELLGAETKVYNSERWVHSLVLLLLDGSNGAQICTPNVCGYTITCHQIVDEPNLTKLSCGEIGILESFTIHGPNVHWNFIVQSHCRVETIILVRASSRISRHTSPASDTSFLNLCLSR